MRRAHGRQLSKGGFDNTIIIDTIGENNWKMEELDSLGEQFLADKERIEDLIDSIDSSNLDANQKEKAKRELQAEKEALIEKYDKQVETKQKELQENTQENIEILEQNVEDLQEQADSIRNIQSDSKAMDISSTVDAIEASKQQVQEHVAREVERLNSKIEQQNIQSRNMRKDRLSGKN